MIIKKHVEVYHLLKCWINTDLALNLMEILQLTNRRDSSIFCYTFYFLLPSFFLNRKDCKVRRQITISVSNTADSTGSIRWFNRQYQPIPVQLIYHISSSWITLIEKFRLQATSKESTQFKVIILACCHHLGSQGFLIMT